MVFLIIFRSILPNVFIHTWYNSGMYLELGIIIIFVIILSLHLGFRKIYSDRIRELSTDVEEMKSQYETSLDESTMNEAGVSVLEGGGSYETQVLEDAIMDLIRVRAQTKINLAYNTRAIAVNLVCVLGLSFLLILHITIQIEAAGWMSALLLLPAGYLLWHHIYDMRAIQIRGWRR